MTTDGGGSAVPVTAASVSQLPPRYLSESRRTVGSIDGRLRRLEEHGHRCSECGLTPSEHGCPVAVYQEPDKGFQGDPEETCKRCGRNLYTVINVVYEGRG